MTRKEAFDHLEIEESLTDPNGNTYTGSLDGGTAETVDDGTVVAAPGEVQATVDAVESDGGGVVRLRADATYSPGEAVVVPQGVTLDCNHAVFDVRSDHDVFVLGAGGRIRAPRVDAEDVGFTSRVFVLDVADERYPDGTQTYYAAGQDTWIDKAYVTGDPDRGTTCYLHQDYVHEFIGEVRIDVRADGGDTFIDVHSEASDGFINTVRFTGYAQNFRTFVHMRGPGDMYANMIDVDMQPNGFGVENGEVGWHVDSTATNGCAGNIYEGQLWDYSGFSDALWRLDAGVRNVLDNRATPMAWDPAYIQGSDPDGSNYYLERCTNTVRFADDPGQDRPMFG